VKDLGNRGVVDLMIAFVDELKGFPKAINAVFPGTMVQPHSGIGQKAPNLLHIAGGAANQPHDKESYNASLMCSKNCGQANSCLSENFEMGFKQIAEIS
jgi:hypothetical protein